MGHVDVQTTMNYLHHAPRGDEAALVAGGVWDPRHATAPRRAATLKWPEDCLFVQSSDLPTRPPHAGMPGHCSGRTIGCW